MSSPDPTTDGTLPLFSKYITWLLREKKADTVVEIGSDARLDLAFLLGSNCGTVHRVNLPEDHARLQNWYEMRTALVNKTNVRMHSGNAMDLQSMVGHADVIVLNNVLIAHEGSDIDLMWRYRRNELECSEAQWGNLMDRFTQAEETAYGAFLQVAKPGHIVQFGRPESDGRFLDMLSKVGVDKNRIEIKTLIEHRTFEDWQAYIIDNS